MQKSLSELLDIVFPDSGENEDYVQAHWDMMQSREEALESVRAAAYGQSRVWWD